jgi:CRISPR-associated protein Csd1
MIPGSQATAKLVSFQVKSGYDSYGKEKGGNAPISVEAESAYTTALNKLLGKDSRNKFNIGSRTFVFWASAQCEKSARGRDMMFDFMSYSNTEEDDPNKK